MAIPLEKRLRKRLHTETAMLQDEVMDTLYSIENKLVLHGGTAIWRCYGGNRFSEDLDFYCKNVHEIERQLNKKINERGIVLQKFKKTENLIFCKISNGAVEVRIEINFSATKNAVARQYEKTDGSLMDVFTLSEEELILEKISAYESRKFIRDIYDVYYLSGRIKDNAKVMNRLKKALLSLPEPVDESNLRVLLYSGAMLSFNQIRESLKRRFL